MLPMALGAMDSIGKIAGGLNDSGPSSAAASFGNIAGPTMGRAPWSTTDKAIAAFSLVLVVALVALVLKSKKG